jgi:hypothetical protein
LGNLVVDGKTLRKQRVISSRYTLRTNTGITIFYLVNGPIYLEATINSFIKRDSSEENAITQKIGVVKGHSFGFMPVGLCVLTE